MFAPIDRRTFLQGAGGVAISLPFLEAMTPRARGAAGKPPVRLAFIHLGLGTCINDWYPTTDGPNYKLTKALEPLAKHRKDFSVITGTQHMNPTYQGHGTGLYWLTAHDPRKGKSTISVDQYAAAKVGMKTRFSSLQWGAGGGNTCLSWSAEGTPLPTENSPLVIFERLFTEKGKGDPATRRAMLQQGKSILDGIGANAAQLNGQLGKADQEKLDEYLNSIREVERRLLVAESYVNSPVPKPALKDSDLGKGKDRLEVMYDLLVAAFQTDVTRIVAYAPFDSLNGGALPKELGLTSGWHGLSHHQGDPEKINQLLKIDIYVNQRFGYLLERLQAVKEADGSTLLDNCLILQGCSLADGNRHWRKNLPLILAGHGGGVKQGQHLMLAKPPVQQVPGGAYKDGVPDGTVPTSNVFVSMLNAAGIPTQKFADSTGPLKGLL